MKTEPFGAIAAVIFDLDGTLVDTLDDIRNCLNDCIARIGVAPVDRATVRSWIGEGVRNLIRRASGATTETELDGLVRLYLELYRRRLLDHTDLYPGVAELLDSLVQRDTRIAVLSNKPHEFTVTITQSLLARWRFDGMLGASDETQRKPDPTQALALARSMQQPPQAVLVVGDGTTDILVARNAGMRSAAVTWGYRDRDILAAAGPDYLIDDPAELLPIVTRVEA